MAQGAPFRFTRNELLSPRQGTSFTFTRNAAVAPRQGNPFTFVRSTPIIVSGSTTFITVRGEASPVPSQGSTTFITVRGEVFPVPEQGSATFRDLRGTADLTNGLIRGPQFRSNTIADDRFVNRLSSVLSNIAVDLSSTGQTTIYTVPSGNIALIQGVVFLARGTATSDPTVSVGINPSTDNIFDSQQLVNFQANNDVFSLWSDKSTTLVANGSDQIDVDVTIASLPQTPGMSAEVYVIGHLL
jgi:hypothetical protein